MYDELVRVYRKILYLSTIIDDQDLIKEQYSQHCFLKGREISRINQMSSLIHKSNDDQLIKTYNDFIEVNKQIATAIEMDLNQRKPTYLAQKRIIYTQK